MWLECGECEEKTGTSGEGGAREVLSDTICHLEACLSSLEPSAVNNAKNQRLMPQRIPAVPPRGIWSDF